MLKTDMLFTQNIEDYLSLSHHVYLKDICGFYLECNDYQAKSFGCEVGKDVIGKSDKDFHSEDELQVISTNDKEVLLTKSPKVVIEHATFVQKENLPFLSYKIPYQNALGKVLGVFGISIMLNNVAVPVAALSPIPSHTQNKKPAIFRNNKLTNRERQCVEYLMMGKTSKEIARILGLSPRTIETYLEKLKQKFQCANRVELAAKLFAQMRQ